jgi:hypothetical protein
MVRTTRIGIVPILLLATAPAFAGDPGASGPRPTGHFFHRLGPVGGCNPDGRGIFHWWERGCFALPCTPDDYCRKPMPALHCLPRPGGVVHGHGCPATPGCPTCAGTR